MAKRPCVGCSKMLSVGPTSLPEPKCHPCRRRDPKRKPRRLVHECRYCGGHVRSPRSDSPACRACHDRMKRRPPLTNEQRAAHAERSAIKKRRRSALHKIQKAAVGTSATTPFVSGPCNWCGAQFTAKASAPTRWCSDACHRRASKQRRTTREFGGTGWRWSDFMKIARRGGYCCAYCGTKPGRLDPDHVVPLSRGGDNSTTNLLPACMPCNSDKRDLLLNEWADDRARRGLPPRNTSTHYPHLALPPARERVAA